MLRKLLLTCSLISAILAWGAGDASAQQSLSLKAGFNFIAFTLKPAHTPQSMKAEFPQIEEIYGYSAASGSFLTASEGTLATLNVGRGYIIKTSAAFTLAVSGAAAQAGNITLKSGFNLTGFSRAPEALTFSAFMQKYQVVAGMYRWSPASGSFIQVLRNASGIAEALDGVDPAIAAGQSYFVRVASDTTLNYDGASILVGDGGTTPPPAEKTLTALTISKTADTTAAGTAYDLSKVTATAGYSDNTTKAVTPSWEIASGSAGTLSGMAYTPAAGATTATLVAKYSEGAITKTANLSLAITGGTAASGVIHSKAAGGNWTDASTWVEGIVPTKDHGVEINGPVYVNAESPCKSLLIRTGATLTNIGRGSPYSVTPTTVAGDLTIESGATLANEKGWSTRVLVQGNLINNGRIVGDGGEVHMELAGNLSHNGDYSSASMTFKGVALQTVSMAAGKKLTGKVNISNAVKSIKAASDLSFENAVIVMSDTDVSGSIDMAGFKINVSGGAIALQPSKGKFTNVGGIGCAQGAIVYESIFAAQSAKPILVSGYLTTVGRAAGGVQVTIEGDATIDAGATLTNETGWRSGVMVTGSLINNGTVLDSTGGMAIYAGRNLSITGNYTAYQTFFNGTGEQLFSMAAGRKVTGTVTLVNSTTAVKASSDLTFENTSIFLGDGVTSGNIDMNGHKIKILGGNRAFVPATSNGTTYYPAIRFINVAGIDCAQGAVLYESRFVAPTASPLVITGYLTAVGRGAGGVQVIFEGDVTVAEGATVQNETGWRCGIMIYGNFVNHGTLKSSGGSELLVINGVKY